MCHFSSFWGSYCHPAHYICAFMTWKRGTRPLCSLQQESWKTFSLPFPSLWLHFHLPDGGCALTFAAINLLVYLDFPSLMCLNELNGHSCGQIYPKLELSLLGRATQSESPPTAITDSIILSKGTYSINDIHLILSSINLSKRSLKFKDYGNVTVFEECLYSTFFIFNYSRTVGNSNHRALSCYF